MSTAILRTAEGWWVVGAQGDRAHRVATDATTTASLLADRDAIATAATAGGPATPIDGLALLSPVTAPCRVVAQMVNYRSHAIDSGFDPAKVPVTFFRKASGSITSPTGAIVKPAHVRLLDYEVELGLVFGAAVPVGTKLDGLAPWVAGLVVTNDVSARDVQLPKTQFYEAKSYPTFTPVGPRLVLVDAAELARIPELRLQLRVNGALRQDRTAADMIATPGETLAVLARFQELAPGDLLLTGTPGGTALKAPPRAIELVSRFLPPAVKWKAFFDRQAKNPDYLREGDVVEASIRTADGAIDLGTQRHVVSFA